MITGKKLTMFGATDALPTSGVGRGVVGGVRNLFGDVVEYRRLKRDYAALLEQPDFRLADMGMTRAEIEKATAAVRLFPAS